jgi:hypothetical protein
MLSDLLMSNMPAPTSAEKLSARDGSGAASIRVVVSRRLTKKRVRFMVDYPLNVQ